jgi:hypothetical protein
MQGPSRSTAHPEPGDRVVSRPAVRAAFVAVVLALAGCGQATAATPTPEPGPPPVPQFAATYTPSKSDPWNDGVQAGIAYWAGIDGTTPPVVIRRDPVNRCGPHAVGCTTGWSDGTQRIWVKKHVLRDRWATTAVLLHEVGHAFGKPHIDGDLVMSP